MIGWNKFLELNTPPPSTRTQAFAHRIVADFMLAPHYTALCDGCFVDNHIIVSVISPWFAGAARAAGDVISRCLYSQRWSRDVCCCFSSTILDYNYRDISNRSSSLSISSRIPSYGWPSVPHRAAGGGGSAQNGGHRWLVTY